MQSKAKTNSYTAVVAHYYLKRRDYIPRIMDSLRGQSLPPDDIIIWNNGLWLDQSCEILSHENTLMGRYAAAICLAKTPHVLIVDDDLILGRFAAAHLMDHHNFGQITGKSGVYLNREGNHPYSTGQWTAGKVDVVQGRCFLADRMALLPGLRHIVDTGLQPEAMDDILFSLACGRCFAVAGVGFDDLDEHKEGLSHVPDWIEQRDKAALFYMKEFDTK